MAEETGNATNDPQAWFAERLARSLETLAADVDEFAEALRRRARETRGAPAREGRYMYRVAAERTWRDITSLLANAPLAQAFEMAALADQHRTDKEK